MSELSINVNTSTFPTIELKKQIGKNTTENSPTTFQSIISGGVGGAFMAIVGHPLDLIKVRQQAISNNHSGPQPSIINALSTIIKNEGFRGLYRGLSSPLLASTPIFAVEYASFEYFQSLLKKVYNLPKEQSLSIPQVALAGALAAFPATLVVAPFERIKCMLQVSETGAQGTKTLSLKQAISQVGGIRGLYRGTLATLLRDSSGGIFYFGTYMAVKRALSFNKEQNQPDPFAIMMAGGLAGMANWLICIPADVIKSRQQTELIPKSFLTTFKELIHAEGAAGLFKGLTPALLRAFPANAACFLGVEATLHLLNRYN